MSKPFRGYHADRATVTLRRALQRVNREVFGGKPVPMDEPGALAELEFMVECALDGYELEPGIIGVLLDRETLAEFFDQAGAWNIETVAAIRIINRCQRWRR